MNSAYAVSYTHLMLGAAGAIEAIVSALALQTGVLPPTVGLEEPDPDCDLDYICLLYTSTRINKLAGMKKLVSIWKTFRWKSLSLHT